MAALRSILFGSAGILAVAGAVALAHPGHPPITPPTVAFGVKPPPIPFDLFRGQRIILDGTVNGVATPMMLDSGAGATAIDRAFADRIGLKGGHSIAIRGASGEVAGQFASGVSLFVGGLKLTGLNVIIFDLSDIARAIGRPVPVVLGREAFKAGIVTIDFPGRKITFADRAGFHAPVGANRLAMGESGLRPTVKIGIAGLPPVDADLDLGNGGTVILANSYWRGQAALARLPHAQGQSGGVGGLALTRRVTLPSVEFAGLRLAGVPAALNEDPQSLPVTGANVGIEMLKSFVVTFDATGNALYLQRPASTANRAGFERDRAGVRPELLGDRLKLAYVSPDGPSAAAGLRAGDEIASIDGRAVDPGYYSRPDWTRGEAGREVVLQRTDGSEVRVALRDYY
ncbi:MAG: aspartyl protease family protein [Sphingomicrobium sp.]